MEHVLHFFVNILPNNQESLLAIGHLIFCKNIVPFIVFAYCDGNLFGAITVQC